MKKAVAVLAHQFPDLLNKLIKQLTADNETDVYIHINKFNENITSQILKDKHVHVTKNNVEIHWGGDGILRAILILYDEILKSGKEYEYVLLMTGQNLMVKNGINEFLEAHKGEIFIQNDPLDRERNENIYNYFIKYRWSDRFREQYDGLQPIRIIRAVRIRLAKYGIFLGKRKKVNYNTENLKIYFAWYFTALPIDVLQYIMDFITKEPGFLDLFLGDALVPEEYFFGTLLFNSQYNNRIKYIDGKCWSVIHSGLLKNHNHAKDITMGDIDEIEHSDYFFMRKFNPKVDNEVIEYFYNKTMEYYK